MKRQRCLLVETVRQKSGAELLRRYVAVTDAIGRSVRTTLSASNMAALFETSRSVDIEAARTLVLVPPLIKPSRPDVPAIRAMVTGLLRPADDIQDQPAAPSTTVPAVSSTVPATVDTVPEDKTDSAALTVGEACAS